MKPSTYQDCRMEKENYRLDTLTTWPPGGLQDNWPLCPGYQGFYPAGEVEEDSSPHHPSGERDER